MALFCHYFSRYLSVLQEAVSTRDPELVRLVLRYRDYQRTAKRLAGIPVLLERLRQVSFHTNTCKKTKQNKTTQQLHIKRGFEAVMLSFE